MSLVIRFDNLIDTLIISTNAITNAISNQRNLLVLRGKIRRSLTLCYLIYVHSPTNRTNFYLDSLSFVNKFLISILFYLGQTLSILRKVKFVRMATNLGAAIDFELTNLSEDYNESKPDRNLLGRVPRNISIYDYLIIGSGPGATQAFETHKQNNLIAVIERGGLPRTPINNHHTFRHLANDFYNGGQQFIVGRGVHTFSQGNVFGGGSEVNAGFYHKLPSHLVDDFSHEFNIESNKWEDNEILVQNLLKPRQSFADPSRSLISRGASNLGIPFAEIPRWTYLKDDKVCHFGLVESYWQHQVKNGDFYLESTIFEITDRLGYFDIGFRDKNGEAKYIKSKRIIFSAGAIDTPFLLAKFNFIDWKERAFQWHPMQRVLAKTNESDLGNGFIDPFQAWDEHFRYKFGSSVSTKGLLTFLYGKEILNENVNLYRSYYISIASDHLGSFINRTKIPKYILNQSEVEQIRDGISKLAELIKSGGGHLDPRFNSTERRLSLSTVHVFGTLPMNSRVYIPDTTILKSNPRIQVLDGSILPKPPFVNPQGVIMTACKIMAKLNYEVS